MDPHIGRVYIVSRHSLAVSCPWKPNNASLRNPPKLMCDCVDSWIAAVTVKNDRAVSQGQIQDWEGKIYDQLRWHTFAYTQMTFFLFRQFGPQGHFAGGFLSIVEKPKKHCNHTIRGFHVCTYALGIHHKYLNYHSVHGMKWIWRSSKYWDLQSCSFIHINHNFNFKISVMKHLDVH